jgi:hypothetical protein
LLNTPQYEVNVENIQINPLSSKILIASSRFMSISGCSVSITQSEDAPSVFNGSVKVLNNKFYNSSSYSGILSFSNLYLSGGLEVNKNDLIRNTCGHGIQLTNV